MLKFGATTQEVATPTPECPNPQEWTCYDGMATEVEVLEFLGALVRMMRPRVLIETGSYLGYGTAHLAAAVRDNKVGALYSAEPDMERANKARELLGMNGLADYAKVWCCPGEALIRQFSKIDFAFLDSNLDTRIDEMQVLNSRLTPSGIVAVHDTNTLHDQNGGPRTPFRQFAFKNNYQAINFDTPRGLMLLRKRP